MTKSRKQKLKKQDFLKKKLKVGKKTAKPSNVTDTSFVAKTISIKNQHLDDKYHNDLSKRFPLLRHHNSTVRKETLNIFIKAIPQIIKTRLMAPLLTQSIPLICDDSKDVRDALLELLVTIGDLDPHVLILHCNVFVLYINMSMTHIIPRIQADSSRFLMCLLKYCGDEIVRKAWLKLMQGLLTLLGWNTKVGANQGSGVLQTRKRDLKFTKVHLETLFKLIELGCTDQSKIKDSESSFSSDSENVMVRNKFLVPDFPQPYEHLKLFERQLKQNKNITFELTNKNGSAVNKSGTTSSSGVITTNNNNNMMMNMTTNSLANQDLESRQSIFQSNFQETITKQCHLLIKEGGECGKTANNLQNLITQICS